MYVSIGGAEPRLYLRVSEFIGRRVEGKKAERATPKINKPKYDSRPFKIARIVRIPPNFCKDVPIYGLQLSQAERIKKTPYQHACHII